MFVVKKFCWKKFLVGKFVDREKLLVVKIFVVSQKICVRNFFFGCRKFFVCKPIFVGKNFQLEKNKILPNVTLFGTPCRFPRYVNLWQWPYLALLQPLYLHKSINRLLYTFTNSLSPQSFLLVMIMIDGANSRTIHLLIFMGFVREYYIWLFFF